ncbi:MAG TPA: serine--tRNA ligase [Acidobacteriaceae bacterium]
MLDLAFLRANLALVEAGLRARGQDPAVLLRDFLSLDAERRASITAAEQLKAERNRLSGSVAELAKSGQADAAAAVMEKVRQLKQESSEREAAAAGHEELLRNTLAALPNLPHASVPPGSSELENVEIKRWSANGDDPEAVLPAFQHRSHWELGEALGILDLERAAKLSGARFAVWWGEGARLDRALSQFMLDFQVTRHGYVEVVPPLMVNSRSLFGTGQMPKFAEDLFRCDDTEPYQPHLYRENDHWLIPTAEVPLANLYRDEVLDEADLPLSLTACTPCFRSEAGSYGRDVRGIIRQHQFHKVELVKFAPPEESEREHERLTEDAEAILEALELPYRRMLLCAGDMGFSAMKTYDLEVWLPGQGLYREISSCSNCGDFQARRANIRYRAAGKAKPEHLHTLNGSGLAVGRTWVAVLENYQQPDGTVRVPKALVPYMGGLTLLEPRTGAARTGPSVRAARQ